MVTGAWVRITRAKRWRYAWLFGIGAVIVMLARLFEGPLLVVPALIALGMANRTARVWLPIVLTCHLGARHGPSRERAAAPLLCGAIILAFQAGESMRLIPY